MITIVSVVCLILGVHVYHGIMPQNFFPVWISLISGQIVSCRKDSVFESEDMMSDIEAYLLEQDEVVNVSVTIGDRHCGIIPL